MSKTYKVYTDMKLLEMGRPVQMLIPFAHSSIAELESQIIESGRFDNYINNINNIFKLSSIEECDVFLLPIYYDLSENRAVFEEKIKYFIDKSQQYKKKILIFAGHDLMNINISINNAIIFNSAIDKSKQAVNEQSWPHFFEDFLNKYNNNILKIRLKGDKPVIGFCGYAPPLNIGVSKEKIVSSIKLIANYIGLIQKYSGKISHSYRARAIIGLRNSKKIIPNFRLKNNFAFGPSGLNSGNTNESNNDFRMNFVKNIIESDYTLCVRGIGNNSIRFFETLCCGRIPIFINTDSVLPYDSVVEWKKVCIWIEEKDIDNIDDIVTKFHNDISEEDFIYLQKKTRAIWEEYLSAEGFFKNLPLLFDSTLVG